MQGSLPNDVRRDAGPEMAGVTRGCWRMTACRNERLSARHAAKDEPSSTERGMGGAANEQQFVSQDEEPAAHRRVSPVSRARRALASSSCGLIDGGG